MGLRRICAVVLLLLLPGLAQAAKITLLVPPVWLEREAQSVAIAPGATLQPGDILRTGPGAAARVEPGDGSTLDLGAESALGMTTVDPVRFSVEDGMVRYAAPVGGFTETLQLTAGRLQVELNSGELLAGVRAGTGELLLVSGEARVSAPQAQLPWTRYSEPRSWYRLDNGALEQGRLEPEIVARRVEALRTDRRPQSLQTEGPWVANVISLRDQAAARTIVEELVTEGYPARLSPTRVQGRLWHRVQMTGFTTETHARELGNQLAQRYGAPRAWVHVPDQGGNGY